VGEERVELRVTAASFIGSSLTTRLLAACAVAAAAAAAAICKKPR